LLGTKEREPIGGAGPANEGLQQFLPIDVLLQGFEQLGVRQLGGLVGLRGCSWGGLDRDRLRPSNGILHRGRFGRSFSNGMFDLEELCCLDASGLSGFQGRLFARGTKELEALGDAKVPHK
jgi:hypothetical protein